MTPDEQRAQQLASLPARLRKRARAVDDVGQDLDLVREEISSMLREAANALEGGRNRKDTREEQP